MHNLEQKIAQWRASLANAMPQRDDTIRELEDHLREQIDNLLKQGLSPNAAFESSVERIGDARAIGGEFARVRPPFRTQGPREPMRRSPWLTRVCAGLFTDVRQALRQLRKSKGLTVVTLATLALCIGATTAIFSMVYALMLKPLPFPAPNRIVEIYNDPVKTGAHHLAGSLVQYLDYSKNAKSYESVALWFISDVTFGGDTAAERMSGVSSTADIFEVLQVKPLIGQYFTKENSRPNENKVVVLTQSFWEARFGADPGVLDKTVWIDGATYKIIGVAPRILEAFDARVKFVRPYSWQPAAENPQARYNYGLRLFGRLKPDVVVGQAAAEAGMLTQRAYDAMPPVMREFIDSIGVTEKVVSVQADRVEPVKGPLYLLQGGVAFVLLIGCVNVANLLLVRANARLSDLAIRFTLGASSGTIVRQLMAESLVLTGFGALLGTGLAWSALRVMNRYTATIMPQALLMTLDGPVLTFAVALTVVVGIFIGLIPVVHLLRTNLADVIQRSSRGASAGRRARALSSVLVVGQVTFALILLTGAGLLIHSFAKVLNVNPGLDPRGVVTGRVAMPPAYRGRGDAAKAIQERLLQALREIPGVSSVALALLAADTPFSGKLPTGVIYLKNPLPPGSPQPVTNYLFVSPGYLTTLGLTLVEGRFLEEVDQTPGHGGYVIDESFARKFFPGRSAVGEHYAFGRPEKDSQWSTVVGVVRDVPQNGVEDRTGTPFSYQFVPFGMPTYTLFLRTTRPAAEIVAVMREKIRGLDPTIALFDTGTMEEKMDSSLDNRRAVMLLLVAFAGLALFLSALGIYGVLAYDVSQRTREIGIRGAIGATPLQLIEMILKQGLGKAGIGLVLGLVGAGLLSRFMTSLLFEVTPTDPIVYAGVSLLLLVVSALASYLPARRAAKIDPLVALRCE